MAATAAGLVDAVNRRRRVRLEGRNGPRKLLAGWAVRREGLRIVKHLLCFYGVLTLVGVPTPPGWDTIETRTAVMIVVGALLGLTSVLDMFHRHRLDGEMQRLGH